MSSFVSLNDSAIGFRSLVMTVLACTFVNPVRKMYNRNKGRRLPYGMKYWPYFLLRDEYQDATTSRPFERVPLRT